MSMLSRARANALLVAGLAIAVAVLADEAARTLRIIRDTEEV